MSNSFLENFNIMHIVLIFKHGNVKGIWNKSYLEMHQWHFCFCLQTFCLKIFFYLFIEYQYFTVCVCAVGSTFVYSFNVIHVPVVVPVTFCKKHAIRVKCLFSVLFSAFLFYYITVIIFKNIDNLITLQKVCSYTLLLV